MDKQAAFTEYLNGLYPGTSDLLSRHQLDRPVTFRFVQNRSDVEKSLQAEGYMIEETPITDFYTATGPRKLSESTAFNAHQIYIQSLSSALPVLALDPQPTESILDLCAAPGSKTTLMASHMKEKGSLVAVEKQPKRYYKLQDVLRQYGASWVQTVMSDGAALTWKYQQYAGAFDKILADVPCSNEAGVSFDDKKSLQYWHPRKGKELSGTQKKLLASAVRLAQPKGRVVYSTCTYNPAENELVVQWALKKFPEWKLAPIELEIKGLEVLSGFTTVKNKTLDVQLQHAVRVVPNRWFSGFFIAMFVRT